MKRSNWLSVAIALLIALLLMTWWRDFDQNLEVSTFRPPEGYIGPDITAIHVTGKVLNLPFGQSLVKGAVLIGETELRFGVSGRHERHNNFTTLYFRVMGDWDDRPIDWSQAVLVVATMPRSRIYEVMQISISMTQYLAEGGHDMYQTYLLGERPPGDR